MLRFSCLLSVRHEFSIRTRLLIALLALVQIIAPTWHICELGGNNCCPPASAGETNLHCALPTDSRVLASPQTEKNLTSQTTVSSPIDHQTENCLAKLLLGMPWQSVLPVKLPRFFSHSVATTSIVRHRATVAALSQPPARAPPFTTSLITHRT